MKRSWETLSQQSGGLYTVHDFERAAYRLVTRQVLAADERATRNDYHLVETWLSDFASALAPLGVRLERNAHYRYVVALPSHAEGMPVSLDETLLVLILRQRYDLAMREGRIEDRGEAVVELPELQEAYPALTGRQMPDTGRLRELLRSLRRWSLCQLDEDDAGDGQPFRIVVRPAIVEIVGEQWLQRLDQHGRADDTDGDDTDEAMDEADVEEADVGEADVPA